MRWAVTIVVLAACSYHAPDGTPAPIDAALGGGLSGDDAMPDAIPAEQRCTMRYGMVDSFQLCQSSETQCIFEARTAGGNCLMACTLAGGTCVESRDGDCDSFDNNQTHDCLRTLTTQVCFCSN